MTEENTLTNSRDIYEYCFNDLINAKEYGFGKKRLEINIPNTISSIVPCSGFGYKDQTGKLLVGLRLYWEQGDYVKYYKYDGKDMQAIFIKLVNDFDLEFRDRLNKM